VLLFLIFVVYPWSFGPAQYAAKRGWIPVRLRGAYCTVYWPVMWLRDNGPFQQILIDQMEYWDPPKRSKGSKP
jgi:hypothetical protein